MGLPHPAEADGEESGTAPNVAPDQFREVSQLDDFQVIAERFRIMAALATLTDRYRALTHEMNRRETLRWMVDSS
jgi:hypothetical protein